MFAKRLVVGALSVMTTLGLVVACSDDAVPEPCTNIPPGGCPRSHGVACEDPTCEAIYLCRPNNVWELSERCPARDAAPEPDAQPVADAAPFTPDATNLPPGAYGGPGCEPLQAPDCSVGFAAACGPGCCECEDLFICEDNGWTLWGACGDL